MPLIRTAVDTDIPELVRLRALLFGALGEAWGSPPPERDWRDRCSADLALRLSDGSMRILVIDGTDGLAACGIGTIDRRLPSPYNPVGLIGHVFGVVTDPAYQRRGYGRAVMERLLAWFDDRGVKRVDLNASPAGMPLYRELGFVDHADPTLSRSR
jgi:GNAT superfamily N-acetyltransferase